MEDKNWKLKTIGFSAISGLVVGLISGYLRVKDAEKKNKQIHFSRKEAFSFGYSIFDTVRKHL